MKIKCHFSTSDLYQLPKDKTASIEIYLKYISVNM